MNIVASGRTSFNGMLNTVIKAVELPNDCYKLNIIFYSTFVRNLYKNT